VVDDEFGEIRISKTRRSVRQLYMGPTLQEGTLGDMAFSNRQARLRIDEKCHSVSLSELPLRGVVDIIGPRSVKLSLKVDNQDVC
jgi:hypothetical protein